ncbi:hypothetical protein HY345_02350 [Candidatus Microgenomates bacterium]|nr:hypothetical protein [Candidatus Microgenomates bacterium]
MNKLPIILFCVVLVNLLFLDYYFFIKDKNNTQSVQVSSPANNEQGVTVTPDPIAVTETVITSTPTPTEKPAPQPPAVVSASREFFISFGTGSSSANDWEDIAGLQVTVDSESYNKIKSTTFEATLRIPTGNESASVRLFNVTDKHPVWFSEMSMDGGTPKFLSAPITLDTGNKTYQVQMKTSLKYPAYLDQARIHIVTY